MPNHRILASCVALSFLMHLVMVAVASLPPKAGILKGGRPKPPPPKPPRVMEGRVPDLPVNPALPPEESFPLPRPGEAPAERPAASAPVAPGRSGKTIQDLNPTPGRMVLAMEKTASRGSGSTAGKTVGTGGKAGEKDGVGGGGGEGGHRPGLQAPQIP